MTRATCVRAIAVLTLPVALTAQGQRRGAGPDQTPGRWIATRVETRGDAAIAKSWERQLRAIEALIKAAPVFSDIRGYYPLLLLKAEPVTAGKGLWRGYVALEAWPRSWVDISAAGEVTVKPSSEENRPEGMWISLNSRWDLSHWSSWQDEQGTFYELPARTRDIEGFPVIGDRFFITKSGEPPFDPLPYERALRWTIANLKRQIKIDQDTLASAKKAYDDFMSPAGLERRRKAIDAAAASQTKPENQAIERRHAEAIDKRREQDLRDATVQKPGSPQAVTAQLETTLEAQLAALSPSERAQPAWIKDEPKVRGAFGTIVTAGTPGARQLAIASAFFNPALPPDAIQLVTVPFTMEDRMKSPAGPTQPSTFVPYRVAEQTDWRAVQKLLR